MECRKILVCLAVMVLAVGSGAWAAHHEGDLSKLAEAWQATYNAGDYAAVVALYAEDGMRMPPDTPTVSGHEGIQAQIQAGVDMGLAKVMISVAESHIQGDVGHGRGTFEGMDAEGNTISKGKWANCIKMVDGEWKIHYDIFNYDAPLAAPASE